MNILILNWRDQKNPKSGGAEKITEELAKRLVKSGHKATLFTASFPKALPEEEISGIKIIREGKQWTVHFWAWRFYKKQKDKFDLVIDEINTIPFFTPWYVKEKKIMYINQLAKEVWWHEAPFPLSLIGYVIEPLYLRIYKNLPSVTISPSTEKDLLNLGFVKKNIFIVYPGLNFKPLDITKIKKEKNPTLLYFGSIRPMKRVDQVVKSLTYIKKEIPNIKLWVAGSGPEKYLQKIKSIIQKKNLNKNVKFWGRVNEEQKKELMKRANLILATSAREGWGIIVIEANACGTPAVVYNIGGLRDSVINNETGIICGKNTPKNLSENVIKLLKDKELYQKFRGNALKRSKNFSWDKTSREFVEIIEKIDRL